MALSFLLAAGLISAPLFAASAPSPAAVVTDVSAGSVNADSVNAGSADGELADDRAQAPVKLESPDGDCFEWKYPKKAECGALSGKTECKAEPSINTLEKDEAKRAACKPEEGAECFCGEDDDEDEDDDDE